MFEFFSNCYKYSHLIPELKTIEHGSMADVIEMKSELISAQCFNLESENKLESGTCENWSTVIMLKDKIMQYKDFVKAKQPIPEDLKKEIMDLIEELF